MGGLQSRHVYNLSSRDVQVYAFAPKVKSSKPGIYISPDDSIEQKERYLIGTIGFKTSKTLKFPAESTRVILTDCQGGSISDIPETYKYEGKSDLVIEETSVGLRRLRLSVKDEKVHGERLLFVVNVDAVTKFSPMVVPSTKGESEEEERSATDVIGHKRVSPPKAGVVSSSSLFGAASCLAVSAVTGGVDNFRKQQNERKAALVSFLTEDYLIPTTSAWAVVGYLGVLEVNWVRLVKRVTTDAAKGTVVGGAVGASVAGGMIGLSNAAVALETAHNAAAASVVRGVGSGLGVVLTGAIVACEVAAQVRKWKTGKIHVRQCRRQTTKSLLRGTVNAGLCGLAILPVGGIVVAVIGGVAFNVCDATFGWSEGAAKKLVKESDNEKEWESNEVHRKLISAARACFGLAEDEDLDERDLHRRLRKWMLSLHPDKNQQQEHPHFHTITAAAAILINEARDGDGSGDMPNIVASDLLPLMDFSSNEADSPSSPSTAESEEKVSIIRLCELPSDSQRF